VSSAQQTAQATGRCPLCPAACEVSLAPSGPDAFRSEAPLTGGRGLCPRGSALGELTASRKRIVQASGGDGGRRQPLPLDEAYRRILAAAGEDTIVFCVSPALPVEELTAVAGWCDAWPQAKLCVSIEPAEDELLLGLEAGGAEYLSDDALAECDGFLVIGNAFAANPVCSRAVFDRRRDEPRTPLVVVDPGCGTAVKFATHALKVSPGMEASALSAVAAGAGLGGDAKGAAPPAEMPSAVAAGEALAGCKRLGVLVVAEYGRTPAWRQIGHLAARLAVERGGGVAPQTTGANALAAVRLAARAQGAGLSEIMHAGSSDVIALGGDLIGMLGWADAEVLAAAAALPNRTTAKADFVLPLAMPGELDGTLLQSGTGTLQTAALLAPPAGAVRASDIAAGLAREAGVSGPSELSEDLAARLENLPTPEPAPAMDDPPAPVLLLGRQAMHAGCGELTVHGSWQQAMQELPELRVSADDGAQWNLKNLDTVAVATEADGEPVRARVRMDPELAAGVVVLPEGLPQCRTLLPSRTDPASGAMLAVPTTARIEP
jgi:hypothetical protein